LAVQSMNFPLFVPTYKLNGRIYRRNFQSSRRNESEVKFGTGDTADLYDSSKTDGSLCSHFSVNCDEFLEELFGSSDEMQSTATTTSANESSDVLTTDMEEASESELPSSEKFVVHYNSKSKKWSAKIKIPALLRRFVIGPQGSVKRKIQDETNCRLVFPSKRKRKSPIEILSTTSEESVMRCRDRIELLLLEVRNRVAFTHFVSIPMIHENIRKKFEEFSQAVQQDDELPDSCRFAALFQQPGKLHLTLTMLSLLDEDEETTASNSLKAAISDSVR
uniref:KH domain-containing protein n=1 Tax=Gongylonema pulchrum TaxID=637853 RepID=A0A183E6K2_9BILA